MHFNANNKVMIHNLIEHYIHKLRKYHITRKYDYGNLHIEEIGKKKGKKVDRSLLTLK